MLHELETIQANNVRSFFKTTQYNTFSFISQACAIFLCLKLTRKKSNTVPQNKTSYKQETGSS